jgi:hypothetical protein
MGILPMHRGDAIGCREDSCGSEPNDLAECFSR